VPTAPAAEEQPVLSLLEALRQSVAAATPATTAAATAGRNKRAARRSA
jgi:non-homologous end joining protein Ku